MLSIVASQAIILIVQFRIYCCIIVCGVHVMQVLSRIVDGSRLRQFKERYGTGLVTGFARVNG